MNRLRLAHNRLKTRLRLTPNRLKTRLRLAPNRLKTRLTRQRIKTRRVLFKLTGHFSHGGTVWIIKEVNLSKLNYPSSNLPCRLCVCGVWESVCGVWCVWCGWEWVRVCERKTVARLLLKSVQVQGYRVARLCYFRVQVPAVCLRRLSCPHQHSSAQSAGRMEQVAPPLCDRRGARRSLNRTDEWRGDGKP